MYQLKHKNLVEKVLHEYGESVRECVENASANEISMSFANMSSADMRFADMRSANMRFANMSSANMSSADMRFADMSSANMSSADMRFADMRSADMSFADMSFADMRFANMSSADMSSADMSSADMENTNFHNADLRHCKRDDDAKLAQLNVCEWLVTIQFDGIHIGCKKFSLEEILNMTEEIAATHDNAAPIRWRRWGKAIQALAIATLGEPVKEVVE